MNLLNFVVPKQKEELSEDLYIIGDFRRVQYEMIPTFIELAMNRLNKLSNGYIVFKNIQEQNMIKYLDAFGYSLKKVTVNIENPDNRKELKPFISFNLPNLIKDTFFYLNGSYYCPGLYILDKPVIYKKNSIKLCSLFSSITIYLKIGNNRAIVGGKNIPVEYFLQWFLGDDESLLSRIEKEYKLSPVRYSRSRLISYFADFFNCPEDEDCINGAFENLFFDDYTREIYKFSYGREFEFRDLVYYALINYLDGNSPHFVDLNEKRIVFSGCSATQTTALPNIHPTTPTCNLQVNITSETSISFNISKGSS